MKIDIHTYPDGADERTLLRYKIAVEQAALDGKPIEITEIELDAWHPYSDVIPGLLPLFRWNEYSYRVARPKIAEGHNPDGLTEDQVETSKGYRLLTADELKLPKQPDLQFWGLANTWKNVYVKDSPCKVGVTYRTKAAPGAYLPKPVQPTTVLGWLNLLPDGYRERALRNRNPSVDEEQVDSVHYAVFTAFDSIPDEFIRNRTPVFDRAVRPPRAAMEAFMDSPTTVAAPDYAVRRYSFDGYREFDGRCIPVYRED